MSNDPMRPVQTYRETAERISTQIAEKRSDPRLVKDFVSVVRSQALEISGFLLESSTTPSAKWGRRKRA